jgi:capsular exopolysaccharide synthesis family protein
MSRIDEALARARSYRPAPVAPASAPVPADGSDLVFPTEEGSDLDLPLGAPAVDAPLRGAAVAAPVPAAAPVAVAASEAADASATMPRKAETGVQVLDSEPSLPNLPLSEKLMTRSGNTQSIEQYRRLAARLHVAQSEQRTRVVMVTSALPGEGKTLSAANLALTLSESYRRQVLLVDADLRRPCVHDIFRLPNLGGLNDGVKSDTYRKVPLIKVTEHLTVLTAGRPDPDPMSVLSSNRMRQVIEEAGATFEWVIVDTPPIGMLSDAHLLTSLVDTVLLVVEAAETPLDAIKTAVDVVGRDRILGVILNRADDALPHVRYGYDYYGEYRAEA